MELPQFGVSEFVAAANQTFEYAFPRVVIVGEVASFKVNQGKFVFFDLKDSESSVGCFMTVWQLKTPIEDGMKIAVVATPKLTQWGKFSLTVQSLRPVGEGNIKKSFELLRAKLADEGLFDASRKRTLPRIPKRVAVITSTQAAGYADFVTILNERWGGLTVDVAHTQVQGEVASEQMIRALRYFNTQADVPDVIVLIRGGGSLDDLAAYNDEHLVREIAASRVPTLVGVGHEVDTTLADLAADVRAATPSNAAQLLVPDRHDVVRAVRQQVRMMGTLSEQAIEARQREVRSRLEATLLKLDRTVDTTLQSIRETTRALSGYNPRLVLERGYAIVRGKVSIGATLQIETATAYIDTEVKHVSEK